MSTTDDIRDLALQGRSQAEIAEKLNLSRQRVYQIVDALRSVDPDFHLQRVCWVCRKPFDSTRGHRTTCSDECATKGRNKEPCDCGGLKAAGAKECRACRHAAFMELARLCAELYSEGKTGAEISAIVGRCPAICIRAARKGGAIIRKPGPQT